MSDNSNLRAVETKSFAVTASGTTVKRSTVSYLQRDGMWLPEHWDEFINGSTTLYRRTTTSYTSYPAQRILGLPQHVSVYDGALTLVSRVPHNYDETGTFTDSNNQVVQYLMDATGEGVIQHDNANYGLGFTARGNLTSVTQHKVEGGAVTGSRLVKRVS